MKRRRRALARYYFLVMMLLIGGLTGCSGGTAVSADIAAVGTAQNNQTVVPVDRVATSLDSAMATATKVLTTKVLTTKVVTTKVPTVTPTATRRATRTPTPPPTSTSTRVPTLTPSITPTPTNTATPTPQPTPKRVDSEFSLTVPILMYHYLSEPPADANAIRRDLSVTPKNFEAQLAYLRQAGYETISMNQLSFAISRQESLPDKPIILTFDDGYRDNYENAFPLLRKYGYTATFFVFTQVIDTANVDYLSWDMVIEMHQAGMEFGSHSYRHPDLSNKPVDFLVFEILGSKEAIEERIKEPVRFFSYPAGAYDETTIAVLDSANFWGAVTTRFGFEQSYEQRFEMPRIRISGNDTVADLELKLP